MKITDFFNQAFYINLAQRTDRQEHMCKELTTHGLSDFVKRYDAVSANPKTPQNCMIASGTSHRNLIAYAKENCLQNILILEDDVFFTPGGIDTIEKAIDDLQKIPNWDIFYFSANIFDNPLKKVSNNLLHVAGCYCIHAYGVHERAYDRLLAYNPATDVPFDAFITMKPFNKYAAYPLAVSQYDSVSDNVGGLISYNKIFEDVYNRSVVDHFKNV